MKKSIFSILFISALAFASCNSSEKEEGKEETADSVSIDAAADSMLNAANAELNATDSTAGTAVDTAKAKADSSK